MQQGQHVTFRSFRFDPISERLWRGAQAISLRPKTFAVLRFLIEHAGQLVTKEELLDAVWPDTSVSDVVPIVCVRELRQALGDQADAPHFIETVPRRGYRFIAPVAAASPVQSLKSKVQGPKSRLRTSAASLRSQASSLSLVGREAELARLQDCFEKARRGERQVVFVSGEVGIGKTAVVEAFLARATDSQHLWVGRGQCLEHYGAGEAYMPVLDALGRLCRGPGGERLVEVLARLAPTWLAQMPSLVSAADLEGLQRKILGATRERMLREMAEAVEALTAEKPLILVLEDLHWSDHSTLDLVSCLAQRQEAARLLLIGTYRPAELHMNQQPLKAIKRELQMHRRCEELPLDLLSVAAVDEYLVRRFNGETHDQWNMAKGEARPKVEAASLQKLAQLIHQRTEGNPLFVLSVVDYLMAQGVMAAESGRWELKVNLAETEVGVPANLQQMIEKLVDGLGPEEQRVLEAASVAGVEFSVAAVAAGLGEEVVQSEGRCAELARCGQFLRSCGVDDWPDGTVAGRYEFIHTLYQSVLYQRLTAGQRLHLHRRIGERKEAGYGKGVGEIIGELAVHFEHGRDYRRAVQYFRQSAQNAVRRYAFQEAIGHFTKGLALLKNWPDTQERTQQELLLHMTVIGPLMALKGEAAPEVERAYAQIWELYQRLGETSQPFCVLFGLWVVHLVRGEFQTAQELGEQIMSIAQEEEDPALLRWAHQALGMNGFWVGELTSARAHLEQAISLYDSQQHPRYKVNPKMVCLSYGAQVLWLLGYPDQALKRSQDALALAQQVSHPYGLVFALGTTAGLHVARREGPATQERAEAMIALSREQGFPQYAALGTLLRGGALAEQGQSEEGIRHMRQGIAASKATGAEFGDASVARAAGAAHGGAGQAEEGLTLLTEAEAAMRRNRERLYEAELYRVKGELTLKQSGVQRLESRVQKEAEECFHQALDIACRQSAKSLELRAVMSLSRLWQQQGNKKNEACQMLAEIYSWFTEGFDTPDLQAARALLHELGG